ncbi:hypothetical protein [Paraburkholderia sp. BCC1886]|uniref:hypothetical protein n=1 Tax=Paraburkholderia sp. BCC1886 TaxID=2562670 RepID=UPI001184350E|nr:hypothetical protein [Paraburkholderia sp. BCC1886]
MKTKGYLVVAFGADRYINLAIALGRSLLLHEPDTPRAVVTDCARTELSQIFTHVIPYDASFGSDVLQKMHIDLYSPFDETLFIDSDCLVVRPLIHVWKRFEGRYFGAMGSRYLRSGDRDNFLNVERTLRNFRVDSLPKFNGGVYYFSRSDESNRFFEYARSLIPRHDEFCDASFRGVPADEALYSVAMAAHGIELVDFCEAGMYTPIGSKGKIEVDVFAKRSYFVKEGRAVRPDIVHFAGTWADTFTYARECRRLTLGTELTRSRTIRQNAKIYADSFIATVLKKCRKWLTIPRRVLRKAVLNSA